jgi:transglutaminase-like putative cysteine protease
MSVFKIHHITRYQYNWPVTESVNEIRIYPYSCPEQEILQHEVEISHQPDVQLFKDYWGNKVGSFNIMESHDELVIESKIIVRTTLGTQLRVDFHSSFDQLEEETINNLHFIELMHPDNIEKQNRVVEICEKFYNKNNSVARVVELCSEYIYKYFKYTKGITTVETTIDEILDLQSGVCQDFAHLLLQLLRTLKIPSRYVSGYICPNQNGLRGEGATHAWVEAWIPNFGWAGIDPTNNVWATTHHVKLAVGRNFYDCSVIKGTFKGPAKQELYVFVSVGYEDGHVFEETTQVMMEKQKQIDKDSELTIIGMHAQQ